MLPARRAREGWTEAAQAMAGRGEDVMLDPETPTTFDEAEWEWKTSPGSTWS